MKTPIRDGSYRSFLHNISKFLTLFSVAKWVIECYIKVMQIEDMKERNIWKMRKTKIVCTLGPSTDDENVLRQLMLEGMSVARMNFSHGSHEEQKKRLVPVYVRKKNMLVNVTGTDKDMPGVLKQKKLLFEEGSGGLFSTLEDYDNFASMLAAEGKHKEIQFLKPETVLLMQTEGARKHLEPEPGYTWGLSVKIRQDKSKGQFPCTEGTYGWSGALGTHFFVSPKDKLDVVFATHRADLGGSGSYISRKIEELVFEIWGENDEI